MELRQALGAHRRSSRLERFCAQGAFLQLFEPAIHWVLQATRPRDAHSPFARFPGLWPFGNAVLQPHDSLVIEHEFATVEDSPKNVFDAQGDTSGFTYQFSQSVCLVFSWFAAKASNVDFLNHLRHR